MTKENKVKATSKVKDRYFVTSIDKSDAREWLLKKHYAKRMCNIMYCFGLFSVDNILVGVITFVMPAGSTLAKSICSDEYSEYVIELNRLITNDNLDKNALSYFVSKSMSKLPNNRIIISFSDLNMGHNGFIYQATNFLYTGLTSNTSMLVDKDGKEFHFRNIGHYQESNKLKVSLVKRRVDEHLIDKIEIGKYLRDNKGEWTAKRLDSEFGYNDTAAHWFRLDAGFSFPSVDDWFRLKDLLGFDNTYDKVMGNYKLIPCPQEIIKKLELTKVNILPKHRYVFFKGSKSFKKRCLNNLKLDILDYPKGENKTYDTSYTPIIQYRLF